MVFLRQSDPFQKANKAMQTSIKEELASLDISNPKYIELTGKLESLKNEPDLGFFLHYLFI